MWGGITIKLKEEKVRRQEEFCLEWDAAVRRIKGRRM